MNNLGFVNIISGRSLLINNKASAQTGSCLSALRRGQGHGKQRIAVTVKQEGNFERATKYVNIHCTRMLLSIIIKIISPSLVFGVPPDCCPDAAAFLAAAASFWNKGRGRSPFRLTRSEYNIEYALVSESKQREIDPPLHSTSLALVRW